MSFLQMLVVRLL